MTSPRRSWSARLSVVFPARWRFDPVSSHAAFWLFSAGILVMTGLVLGTVNSWETLYVAKAQAQTIAPSEIQDLASFVRTAWVASLGGFGIVTVGSSFLAVLTRRRVAERVDRIARFVEACDGARELPLLPTSALDAMGELEKAVSATARSSWEQRETLRSELDRQSFAAELQTALELTDTEAEAYDVLARALHQQLPGERVQLLLADNSNAHLRAALEQDIADSGCPIESPQKCAAVRRGQTLRFEDSERLAACPKLRDRPGGSCSAVCTPVSVMGRAVGVIHAVSPPSGLLSTDKTALVETLATVIGTRVGMLRSLDRTRLQAETDPLTGLLNRRAFEEAATQVLQAEGPHAFVMLDLDHFKRLNDQHGHVAGDRALQLFAQTLSRSVRDRDLVCRYGGEEFCLLLPECGMNGAGGLLDRMRLELGGAIERSGGPAFTLSGGVALTPTHGTTLPELHDAADAALYEAKRTGRDRWVLHGGNPAADARDEGDGAAVTLAAS